MHTSLDSLYSRRVWEYLWRIVFTSDAKLYLSEDEYLYSTYAIC